MAAVTICSDFQAPKIKSATISTVSPSICHEVMGLDAMILVFWMLSFKIIGWCQSKADPHIVFGLCISSQPSQLVSFSPLPPPRHEPSEETRSFWLSATSWIQSTAFSWCGLTCSAVSSISCKMMMEPEAWSDPGSEYNPEVSCGISQGTCNAWLPLVVTLTRH